MRQAVRAMVAEAAVAGRGTSEHPVKGRGLECEQRITHAGVELEPTGFLVHCFFKPGSSFAGRRGEPHQRKRAGALLEQQREQPRDGRGLARARTAGDDRKASLHSCPCRSRLPAGCLIAEQAPDAGVQAGFIHNDFRRGRQAT